ncbi:ACT domain-containing protein [Christensenellaceae bacterium OttesenSCG-928-L17]|nr:ACT domain-containing protein [Christensenellaceae bacterium OttesenSCG-928-L17]
MNHINKAIVTVLGKDRVGIIASVSTRLSELSINILDITQTVMDEDIFVMLMLVDMTGASKSFHDIKENLRALGEERGISVRIQSEEIFNAMHRV